MNQLVYFQLRSTDGCVAALVATGGLLSIMPKHVRSEVFDHLEGEVALNTRVKFVFCLHFHGLFLVQIMLLLINQATKFGDN